ncbi:arginase family protein [Amycolatopsis nigrescens]|uniref:arginase family protein n=1 Tax=Amycolatopsis nigrescens TaxID=381445 RepID=UPI0012F8516D|nr:arginase family protein [Amycolatopsis nigrescens]
MNNPPSESGFFDGMALAMLTGDCWRPLAGTVPGFRPVPQNQVVLAGARDFDEAERARVENSALLVLPPERVHGEGMAGALAELPSAVRRIYLHIDLDVHDRASVGAANDYAADGGPGAEAVRSAVGAVSAAYPIAAVTLSAYDPATDRDHGVRAAALELAGQLGAAAGGRG